jgi:hypothetical protein
MTAWNDFVTKIFYEEREKNPSYLFKNALEDASKRKSEMGTSVSSKVTGKSKNRTMSRKSRKIRKSRKSRKSRKNGKSRKMRITKM